MVDVNKQQILMDIEIRRLRKFYFKNNENNTTLAFIFNKLLEVNGTFTTDMELNKLRETAMTTGDWV